MKYIDLKKNLKIKLENSYYIFGDDRYLCFDALKKIEDAANISVKDMNIALLAGETTSAKDIIDCVSVYPFGDNYRIIVVRDYIAKDKKELKILENYLENPMQTSILIFLNLSGTNSLKDIRGLMQVDCSKLDEKVISAFVKNTLAKNNIASNEEAITSLIRFCANDMTRITGELEKIVAYTLGTGVMTKDTVKLLVTEDREYQSYELAQYLAKNDRENALRLVDSLCLKPGSGFQVLTPLYNNYRRALFVSINKDKTTPELAKLLGVKEYAIKSLSYQISIFSPKTLKKIVDMIAEMDEKIKNGDMKELNAIKLVVFNILNLRGKNG